MSSVSYWNARIDKTGWAELLIGGSVIFIFLLGLISIAVPIATIGFDIAKNYNEGWNAYHAARVAAGEPLYTGDPARLVNYPFLSFYLIASLKPIFGDVLMIGRGLNVAAFLMIGILGSLVIRRLGGGAIDMLFGAACVIGFQAIQARAWIAADEPQMLAEALMLAGLLCYLSGPPRAGRLAICALLFAAGGFTKQILVAIPFAVSLDLLVNDRRRLPVWCACCATALLLFFAVGQAAVGIGSWPEVFAPRAYDWHNIVYHARKLVIAFKWPILGCAVYLLRAPPKPRQVLLRAYGAIGLGGAVIFSGGDGVAGNIYLDFVVFMGLTAGLALAQFRRAVHAGAVKFRYAVIALLFALPIVTRSPYFGASPLDLFAVLREYHLQDDQFDRIEALLQKETGPVLCEDLLLCFEAGKPLVIDTFSATSQIRANRFDAAVVIDAIRHHRFSLIELPVPIHPYPDQPDRFAPYLLNQGRFNKQILTAIDEAYEPISAATGVVLLSPR